MADFGLELRVNERRIPIEGTLETTFRCNLRCVHCYVNELPGSAEIQAREMSLDKVRGVIDEFAERGCLFLLMTGGEVLLRPDFPEIYLHAVRKGLLVTLYTNGTLVTDRIADLLAEYRPFKVEITLYGMTRETYERVTQIPGSYDKCLAGIRRLVEREVPLTLKTMALSWNYHEVPAMEAYARSLGLKFRFDTHLNPRVDCGANRNPELQLTPEQSLALDLADPEKMREMREFCETFARPGRRPESDFVYQCGAGQNSFTVDPYGRLQMCQLSRRKFVDLRERSFDEGWDRHFPEFRSRRWQTNSVCRRCNLLSLCGACPGAVEMETGDVEGILPTFCEIAHRRAFAAMGEDSGHRADARCCLGALRETGLPELPTPAAGPAACAGCGHDQPAGAPLLQIARRAASPSPRN
jgi:radical SAM protein with 4Fe4S-binding SPASM domain